MSEMAGIERVFRTNYSLIWYIILCTAFWYMCAVLTNLFVDIIEFLCHQSMGFDKFIYSTHHGPADNIWWK